MMDKYINRHINKLMLDANNYRFIDNKFYQIVKENEISDKRIQDRTYNLLIGKNEENISDLLTSFKSNGILKLDPIQVKELPDGNVVVIEGNRRTAALKYLYEQFLKGNDVGKLRERDFKSVELVLISDESPIQHLITMGLHHISGKKKWNPVNQAQLIQDLRYKHGLSELEICNSLAINKHNLRRSLRILSLIERYKLSDYGDQFETTMYSIFEEIIKNVKMKNWLQWNDHDMAPEQTMNEEKLFSWISREEIIERNEDGDEQEITLEPIITKSHEIRELSKFINEPKAVDQMEESRNITAGFALSDAVGESRLKNAMDNLNKEVQTAFQFSEFMTEEEYGKVIKLRDKLDKLIPSNSANIELIERNSSIYFNEVKNHFKTINIIKYRKLQNIEITKLNRVNIFAGGNNLGKTSVLELFYLFTRLNNFQSIIDLERFRGRFYQGFPTKWFNKIFVENIEIDAEFNDVNCSLNISKYETNENIEKSHYLNSISTDANVNGDSFSSTIHLFDNKDPEFYFEKSQFLCQATFSSPYRYDGSLLKKAHAKAVQEKYFDDIMIFIREKMDKNIDKIEMVSIENESRFMVSTDEMSYAIDITKYGEGLQRIFEIALLMGYSKNGIICIDELDSAIHKNLLIDFTQFIQELAVKFNVQVFLSTHSKECIDAFVENNFPDEELTAFALSEIDGKVICKYLEGNKLKQLVETINIDIR
ncbi:AAA15 family ATPase/GTPase [Flavobacterium sp. HSC-32F16]|uniref:AAA family ATPase n=1 Tax=Flavobacterium sp. HSC-32F16 TaxID=2910964 RepID=UPI0020A3444A|nr:AAA family ATPase [Flavobacterium sp. HSC-32F16]MCP2026180.1 AAA15 family ATPase/GTPase [Flavobacterium sp. HSC-32F16]